MFRKIVLFSLFMFLGINLANCMVEQIDIESPAALDFSKLQPQELEQFYDALSATLNLNDKGLTWTGLVRLLGCIKVFGQTHTIENLDLRNNLFTVEKMEDVPKVILLELINNQSIKNVLLQGNELNDQIIKEIISDLGNPEGYLKKALNAVLSLFVKVAKEHYNIETLGSEEIAREVEYVSLYTDNGKYICTKLSSKQRSLIEKLVPLMRNLALIFIPLGMAKLFEYFATTNPDIVCDLDTLSQMLAICGFNSTL